MSLTEYRALPREAGMERTITEGVLNLGGRVFSVRDSRRLNVQDMPDLFIIAPWVRTVAHLELKSQTRIITPGQEQVLKLLAQCDRLVSGIVRPVPKPGEISLDAALDLLGVETT